MLSDYGYRGSGKCNTAEKWEQNNNKGLIIDEMDAFGVKTAVLAQK